MPSLRSQGFCRARPSLRAVRVGQLPRLAPDLTGLTSAFVRRCRVTAGCQTRCTLPCLIQHEEGCRALMEAWRGAYDQHNEANAELARLRAENESLQRDKKVMKDAMMSWWQLAVKGAMAKKGWT